MITYQDFEKVKDGDETERMSFVQSVINNHKNSEQYKMAYIADQYNRHLNVTIREYQKLLYTVTGKAVPDNYSANFKMACRHFHRFITQENQFLLGNGVTWGQEDTDERLGTRRYPFDAQLQDAGIKALWGGCSFGFWNLDHMEVFSILEFAPLYDEEDGSIKAGVRFWQIDSNKPLRATLYELDGFTEYIWKDGDAQVLLEKRAYILNVRESEADGVEVYDGENYPTFPIVPLWANSEHQSELIGLREQIDCYDLIKSGFANTVDESSLIYWTIQNAGGMDDVALAEFVERIRTVHAAAVDEEGAKAESHTIEAPYQSREALLDRLDKDLYRDAMALNTDNIASGAVTATQIAAAYEPLNSKCDGYEYCVSDFIDKILLLAGVEDEATFTRSMIVNVSENIQTLLLSAQYLSPDYITKKILAWFGDSDLTEDMLAQMAADDLGRFSFGSGATEEGGEGQEPA